MKRDNVSNMNEKKKKLQSIANRMARVKFGLGNVFDGVFFTVDRYACCAEKNGLARSTLDKSAHHRQDEINNFTREDDERERGERRKKSTHKTPER